MIDSTAVIDPDSKIADGTRIGAYSWIGPGVEIGQDCDIAPHVVIKGPTVIGSNNRIHQFASIGDDPQDKKYNIGEESELIIGNGNVIREYCSISRGTKGGVGVTKIENENWIMAYVHIAHDCHIGSHNVFANNATLAGHVVIDDFVTLGGFTGVHQFCRVGSYSFSAISSVIVKDVAPYLMVSGNVAKPSGLNREGLKRHGFTTEIISQLKKAYKTVYRDGLLLKDALSELEKQQQDCPEIEMFSRFIQESNRGLAR